MSTTAWVRLGLIAAMIGIWIYLLVTPPPRLPIGLANGTYVNACCEPIRLMDGNMFVGGKSVAYYVIEKDKQGPSVLPNANIEVVQGRIEVDRGKYPLKLPVARDASRGDLELPGEGRVYSFKRAPGR